MKVKVKALVEMISMLDLGENGLKLDFKCHREKVSGRSCAGEAGEQPKSSLSFAFSPLLQLLLYQLHSPCFGLCLPPKYKSECSKKPYG